MKNSKEHILAAALKCFMDKGVENTTIADIRDESSVSVGSIYHHFGNKNGIVIALFLTGVKNHSAQQEKALAQAKTAEDGVKAVVKCYIDWIDENPDWARFVFRYRSLVENSQQTEQHEQQKRAHFERLRAWFYPCIARNEIKKLPFEVYHALIIGPSQDFALRWLAGKTKSKLSEHRELYAKAAWQAIRVAQD